jgi:hypothetical protein
VVTNRSGSVGYDASTRERGPPTGDDGGHEPLASLHEIALLVCIADWKMKKIQWMEIFFIYFYFEKNE